MSSAHVSSQHLFSHHVSSITCDLHMYFLVICPLKICAVKCFKKKIQNALNNYIFDIWLFNTWRFNMLNLNPNPFFIARRPRSDVAATTYCVITHTPACCRNNSKLSWPLNYKIKTDSQFDIIWHSFCCVIIYNQFKIQICIRTRIRIRLNY